MTQLVADPVAPTIPALPDLWVLSIVKAGYAPDILTIYRSMRVPAERAVVVSEYPLYLNRQVAANPVVLGGYRDAHLWNAGLDHIRTKQHKGSVWDVLLLDPSAPMPLRAVDSLRHHMRTLDVWMAEPDLFEVIGHRAYQTFFEVEGDQAHPQVAVVAGEMDVRFDRRFFDGADAWADYCRRTSCSGGSVLVSNESLREPVS